MNNTGKSNNKNEYQNKHSNQLTISFVREIVKFCVSALLRVRSKGFGECFEFGSKRKKAFSQVIELI